MHSYLRTIETAKFPVERRLRVSAKYLIRRSGISPPSRLDARSAPAPRERKEVYHKSQRLWVKRFTVEKMPPASGTMILHRGLFLGSDRTFHLRLKALLHVEFSCPSFPLGVVDSLPPYFMATNPPLDHLAVRQLPARQRRQRRNPRSEERKRRGHQVQNCNNA